MTTPQTLSLSNVPQTGLFLRRHLSVLLLGLSLGLTACSDAVNANDSVSLDVARTEHEAGRAVLIDIREPNEHATGVTKGVKLLPMICNTQNRSSSTLLALRERGYKHVKFVQGGMSEWTRRGWPLVKP